MWFLVHICKVIIFPAYFSFFQNSDIFYFQVVWQTEISNGSFFALLHPSPSLKCKTSEIWENKKNAGKIISLHMCVKNHNYMRYCSWDTEWETELIVILDFFALLPPNNPENQNFENTEKASEDVIILLRCTKNHNHMLLFLRCGVW